MKFVDLWNLVMVAVNLSCWKWSVNVKKLIKDNCQIDWLYKKIPEEHTIQVFLLPSFPIVSFQPTFQFFGKLFN